MSDQSLSPEYTDPRFPRHALLWTAMRRHLPAAELAHDESHIARVYAWALRLAGDVGADPDCCGAAAIVHDLTFVPKYHPDRAEGGTLSAAAAPPLLHAAGYDETAIASIAAAVATSSWSKGMAPRDVIGQVLQDADRLDAIGAIGLLRTVACGQWMANQVSVAGDASGRHHAAPAAPPAFYDRADPLARSGRTLDDRRYCVDHLPAKLLHLAAGMHTASARREALRRHGWLLAFLAELEHEVGAGDHAT